MNNDNHFPPIDWLWRGYALNSAWYSGDERQLRSLGDPFFAGGERVKIHVPVARALSQMAAGLLFAGSPTLSCEDEATNLRLQELLKQTGFYGKLLQAAELQSAYGGVLLKLNWNRALAPFPLLNVLPPDAGLPEYRQGQLRRVRFWSELRREEQTGVCYRLEEEYLPDGRILSRLMKGTDELLGEQVPLASIPECDGILPEVDSGADCLLAVYVPNRLPNPAAPGAPFGRSDYEGLHALFSSLDEAYSSLMRDVRLSKARVIVPMEFLRRKDLLLERFSDLSQPGWVFDLNDEVFTALDINPQDSGAGITVVQSQIRAQEHLQAIDEILRSILLMAGISPLTAGIGSFGQGESGTALNVRERLSLQTAEVKKTHWWHAILTISEAMLRLDAVLSVRTLPEALNLSLSFADNAQPDLITAAELVQKLSAAGAVSTEQKVRLVNPDMGEAQIARELERIGDGA